MSSSGPSDQDSQSSQTSQSPQSQQSQQSQSVKHEDIYTKHSHAMVLYENPLREVELTDLSIVKTSTEPEQDQSQSQSLPQSTLPEPVSVPLPKPTIPQWMSYFVSTTNPLQWIKRRSLPADWFTNSSPEDNTQLPDLELNAIDEDMESSVESSLTQHTTTDLNSSLDNVLLDHHQIDLSNLQHVQPRIHNHNIDRIDNTCDNTCDNHNSYDDHECDSVSMETISISSNDSVMYLRVDPEHRTTSLPERIQEAKTELYVLATQKWKVFTITITSVVTISYIVGLSLHSHFDSHSISIEYRPLYMGMIGLWPQCTDNRDQLWRWVTNILSHSGFSHYCGNILGLFGFSYILEMYQPATRLAPLFFLGVIHGNLSFYYTLPYSYAIGVSQGVFAIVGMNIANIIINWDTINRIHSYFILYLCMTVVLSEAVSYDEASNIAYISHWSSGLSGLLGGIALLQQHNPTKPGFYMSIFLLQIYIMYSVFWMYHYAFNWPPLQSYSSVLEPIPTVNCCYEWFLYEKQNGETEIEDFTCPYKVVYEDSVPQYALYKT